MSRPVAEDEERPPVLQPELVDELADHPPRPRPLRERRDVDLDVEVAGVADDRAVLHDREVLVRDDVLVAGHGDEDVADLGGLGHRHDPEAVHRGFEGADRVDLGDDDVRAEPRARSATPLPHQP